MASGGRFARLLERFRLRRARRPGNLWREFAESSLEEDRRAGRVRNREADEKLRCGWSHLHPRNSDEDEAGTGASVETPHPGVSTRFGNVRGSSRPAGGRPRSPSRLPRRRRHVPRVLLPSWIPSGRRPRRPGGPAAAEPGPRPVLPPRPFLGVGTTPEGFAAGGADGSIVGHVDFPECILRARRVIR